MFTCVYRLACFFFLIELNYQALILKLFSLQPGMRLLCSILSLPLPLNSANSSGGEVNNKVNEVSLNHFEQKTLRKLLLVGPNGSGTSTIFKQVKKQNWRKLNISVV